MTTSPAAIKIEKFDTIAIQVENLGRSLEFYADALGIEFTEKSAHAAGAIVAGVRLLLHEFIDPNLKNIKRGAGVDLHFSVADVDACYASLVARGITVDEAPETKPWGREFSLHDPDGYEVEIICPPK